MLGGAVVGASVADDGDGGDQDQEAPAAGATGGDDHLYQVVGTLKDGQSSKPAWVTDIIQVCNMIIIWHLGYDTEYFSQAAMQSWFLLS